MLDSDLQVLRGAPWLASRVGGGAVTYNQLVLGTDTPRSLLTVEGRLAALGGGQSLPAGMESSAGLRRSAQALAAAPARGSGHPALCGGRSGSCQPASERQTVLHLWDRPACYGTVSCLCLRSN